MRCATSAILPLSDPGAAAFSSVSVWKMTTSPSIPEAGVGGDSPSAAMTSGCVLGAINCALSLPRFQAVIGKLSMCTFSKPSVLSLVAAQAAACCSLVEPAGRGPKRVVSSLTHGQAIS